MDVTFHNVTISIEAPTATEAYEILKQALGPAGYFETDTYTTEDQPDLEFPTTDLQPLEDA